MAQSRFGPRRERFGYPEDLDLRLPAQRMRGLDSGQDRAPGRAHDDYTPRQDEGHAYGFVRHQRHYDDQDWYGRRGGAADPGLPPRGPADGGFRGLGPRGYRRSDARIREDVCDRLTDADAIDARGILVTVSEGLVTLHGHVGSQRMKQAAERCARDSAGVAHVQNHLHVRGT